MSQEIEDGAICRPVLSIRGTHDSAADSPGIASANGSVSAVLTRCAPRLNRSAESGRYDANHEVVDGPSIADERFLRDDTCSEALLVGQFDQPGLSR